MKAMRILVDIGKGVAATFVVFLALEALIRVAYAIRDSSVDHIPLPYLITGDYGPSPPWLESRDLISPDSTLVWRGEPNFEATFVDVFGPAESEKELRSFRHSFLPRTPSSLSRRSVWKISTNSEGFRDREFPATKPPGVLRIVCLGDSWTFGSNVSQDLAYPQQLETLLSARLPGRRFEVFNLGVLGYASYNGLKLIETRALDLQPDVVVLAFAMNEPVMAGFRPDPSWYTDTRPWTVRAFGRMKVLVEENVELYRLLRYWALYFRWDPRSLESDLEKQVDPEGWVNSPQSWLPGSLEDYKAFHWRMIELAREHGAQPILLYNEFWEGSPYRQALREISAAAEVPLVDSSIILTEARRRIEADLEERLDLRPGVPRRRAPLEDVTLILRVYSHDIPVADRIFIVGTDSQLGALRPNKVAMYDDGTHGDQRPNDKVWSYSVTAAPGTSFFYLYTNSGREGEWRGFELPAVRSIRIDSTESRSLVYGPIDTFGTLYMHADPWHTNAAGYRLIVEEVLRVTLENREVQKRLASLGD